MSPPPNIYVRRLRRLLTRSRATFHGTKTARGYRLVPGKNLNLKRGQSVFDAVMKMPMKDIQPDRIVGNGGALLPSQPLTIGDLFERFSRIRTPEDAFKFVETHGSLTLSGLRGKGDIVEELINETRDMRSRVSKPLGKLNVMVLNTGGETGLRVRPACLLDALWLQYAQANTPSRECPQCHERFLVGAAAGRRADAEYCSKECRVKYNSLKRSRR
jgi:hypothetical protein